MKIKTNKLILLLLTVKTLFASGLESSAIIMYNNKPQNLGSKINSSASGGYIYKSSMSIPFDILLDEKVESSDPRIKSIIYIAKQNSLNYIQVTYTNSSAIDLSNRLAQIFSNFGLRVEQPNKINSVSEEDLKLVKVIIRYSELKHKPTSSMPLTSQKAIK